MSYRLTFNSAAYRFFSGPLLFLFLGANAVSAPAEEAHKYVTVSNGTGSARVDNDAYDGVRVLTLDTEFHLSPQLGISLGARSFDKFEARGITSAKLGLSGYEICLVASARPSERIVARGRIGFMPYELEARALDTQIGHDEGTSLVAGVGMQFEFNQWFGMHVDAERAFDISGATLDVITAGLFLRMGPRRR